MSNERACQTRYSPQEAALIKNERVRLVNAMDYDALAARVSELEAQLAALKEERHGAA